eukprot:6280048-Prymnesium_polylepis.3
MDLTASSLGAKVSGVDDRTFTSQGEAYSMIGACATLTHCLWSHDAATSPHVRSCVRSAAQQQLGEHADAPVRRRVAGLRVREEGVVLRRALVPTKLTLQCPPPPGSHAP